MIYIKLPERLKQSSPQNQRKYITSDETWSFTEQPKTEMSGSDKRRIPAHDLFNLFTADIIREKTIFIR
jgi:hypothetical protein